MGRRESIATPLAYGRTAARTARRELAAIQLDVYALLQEAKVLQEEASAICAAPRIDGPELHRRSALARQASDCCLQAIERVRSGLRSLEAAPFALPTAPRPPRA